MSYLVRYAALIGASLATVACSKTDASPAAALVGEWEWVSSTGGFTGRQTSTLASTGTVHRWVFGADSTLRVYATRQGVAQPVQIGTYSLGVLQSIHTNQLARSLTLRLPQPTIYLIEDLGSQLVVSDNAYDGFGSTYQRR